MARTSRRPCPRARSQRETAVSDSAILQVQDVAKQYERGGQSVRVLDAISLEVPRGDYVALMGPSGSGKTTLLNIIGGLDSPTTGSVIVDGTNIAELSERGLAAWRSSNIGFVFQQYNLIPVLTALENVALPLLLFRMRKEERRARARGAGPGGHDRTGSSRPPAAQRRGGAAHLHRAGAGDRSQAHHRRRAHRQPRCEGGRERPRPARPPEPRPAQDHPHGDARSRCRAARQDAHPAAEGPLAVRPRRGGVRVNFLPLVLKNIARSRRRTVLMTAGIGVAVFVVAALLTVEAGFGALVDSADDTLLNVREKALACPVTSR